MHGIINACKKMLLLYKPPTMFTKEDCDGWSLLDIMSTIMWGYLLSKRSAGQIFHCLKNNNSGRQNWLHSLSVMPQYVTESFNLRNVHKIQLTP